jgi:hypothetical protein
MDTVLHPPKLAQSLACLILAIFFVSLPGNAGAIGESPWKFAFRLTEKSLGDSLPTALYIDGEKKRYYLVDSRGGQLVSFDDQGGFLKKFSPEGGLNKPFDMVRLTETVIVIVEKGTNSLTTIDFAAKETKRVTVKDKGREIMVDRLEKSGDKLYVLDRASGEICRLSSSFKVAQRFALPEGSKGIVDFKVRGDQVWALGQQEKKVYAYLGNGRISKRVDVSDLVKFPVSLALDTGGLLYVLDRHQGEVVVLDRKTKLKYRFLSKGHGPLNLFYPIEIRFDPWGRLCIVDEGNSRIQVFSR